MQEFILLTHTKDWMSYISFFSIYILCDCIEKWVTDKLSNQKMSRARMLFLSMMILFMIISIWDIIPSSNGNKERFNRNWSVYKSDHDFIAEIEKTAGKGSMIFMLPYHAYQDESVLGMNMNKPLIGYIHSDNLKWSFGGVKGRECDSWYKNTSELPTPELIEVLKDDGFAGIYIYITAYSWDDAMYHLTDLE